jgi:hypothetical protein
MVLRTIQGSFPAPVKPLVVSVHLATMGVTSSGAGEVAEEVAGHADLAATAGAEHVLIQPGPLLDRLVAGGLQPGEGDRSRGSSSWRTNVPARSLRLSESCLPVQWQDSYPLAAFVGHDQGSLLNFGLRRDRPCPAFSLHPPAPCPLPSTNGATRSIRPILSRSGLDL